MHLGALILFILIPLTNVRAELTSADFEPGNNVCGITDFSQIMGSDCVRNFSLEELSTKTSERARTRYIRSQFQEACECLSSREKDKSLMSGAVSAIAADTNYAAIIAAAQENTCKKFEAVHGVVQADLSFFFPADKEFLRSAGVESRETREQASVCHEEETEEAEDRHNDRTHNVLSDDSSTQACIPSRNFRAFMKTPQFDDIFSYLKTDNTSLQRTSWDYNEIRKNLAELTENLDLKGQGYGAVFEDGNPVLAGLSNNQISQIRLYLEQLRFLRYNPVFKYVMMLDPELPAVQSQQTKMLEAFRNVIVSGVDPECFSDGNPHSCKDSFLRNHSYNDIEEALVGSLDPVAFGEGGLLNRILERNAQEASEQQVNIEATPALYQAFVNLPVDEGLCRASGLLAGFDSPEINDRCTRTMGLACGLLNRLPRNYQDYKANRSSPLIDALELSSEEQERAAFNNEICGKAWPPRRGGGPSLTYGQYEARICQNPREPRCEGGQVREGERQSILADYLNDYQTENQDLQYFFKKTRVTYATPAESRYISSGGRVVDAFSNFNVDLPSDWNSRTRTASPSNTTSGSSGAAAQAPRDQQEFNFASAAQAAIPFVPSSSPLSSPIMSTAVFDEESPELREARLEREQRESAVSNKEAELAQAREEGANQERLRSMERELAALRSSLEESGQRYEQLLNSIAKKTEAQAQNAQRTTASSEGAQAPVQARSNTTQSSVQSQASVRAPVPEVNSAASNVSSVQGQNFATGGSNFGGGSVSAGASSAAAQSYNAALADRYRGNERGSEPSLIVRGSTAGASDVKIPVSSEVFSQVRSGDYEQLAASFRSQLGSEATAGTYYLEVQSQSNNSEKTQVIAVIVEGEPVFYTVDQYAALQRTESSGRAPASTGRENMLETLEDLVRPQD